MRDRAIAVVRTLWPALIGHAAAWLLVGTGALGLELDPAAAQQAAGWTLFAAVYCLGRWLESQRGPSWPARVARWVAVVLLGSARQPVYVAGSTGRGEVQR